MKQLICEMCDGTDLIKQDGVFVCQSCGIKYSVEEAKKMIAEDSVEIRETDKVDNTPKSEDLLNLARRYLNENNFKNASTYYEMVLQETPENWEATFYFNYCRAKQCKIMEVESLAFNINNCLESVITLAKKAHPDIKIQKSTVTEIYRRTVEIAEIFFDAAWATMNSLPDEVVSYQINEWRDRYTTANKIFYTIGDIISIEYADDDAMNKLSIKAWEKGLEKHAKYADQCDNETIASLFSLYKTKIASYTKLIKSREEKRKKLRYNEYWAEHANEKIELEARLISINEEVGSIKDRIHRLDVKCTEIDKKKNQLVPADGKLNSLSDKRLALLSEKSKLGLFAGKRKKAIASEIEALDNDMAKLSITAKKQRDELINSVNKELASNESELLLLKKQIQELSAEEQSINSKLTMER